MSYRPKRPILRSVGPGKVVVLGVVPISNSTFNRLIIRNMICINVIRAHFAELGIVAPVGRTGVKELLKVASDRNDKRLPDVARVCIAALGAQLQMLKARILEFDRLIMAWHRSNQVSKRLDELPGVGPALA